MSQDWDFYFCRVDDKPASIFVDLGIAKEAPLAQFPSMAYLRIYMRTPRQDGLSSQEEFASLVKIERAVERVLASKGETVYVGRNTSDGCRDFFFYTNEPESWGVSISNFMRPFSEYKFDGDTRADPQWQTYFGFLHPSEEDRERIQNRRTCESLEESGDDLKTARDIDHWAYFPDEKSREKFIARSSELGFNVRQVFESNVPTETCGVQIFRMDTPSFNDIDGITLPLYRLAKECGGDYDGWEAQVVRRDE